MCRLRQSTSAVSWWSPTSVEFSTDWICSRLACTQEAERLRLHASKREARLHSRTCRRQMKNTRARLSLTAAETREPANGKPLIHGNIKEDLRAAAPHEPWCWRGHVLLISVALPHHPASPPTLCDSLTASKIARSDTQTRHQCEGGFFSHQKNTF